MPRAFALVMALVVLSVEWALRLVAIHESEEEP